MSALSNGVRTTTLPIVASKMPADGNNSSSSSSSLLLNPNGTGISTLNNNPTTSTTKNTNTNTHTNATATALRDATTPADVRAALAELHAHEATLTGDLDALRASHGDLTRSLSRLDNLRSALGAQASAAGSIRGSMLARPADTAARLSGRVRALDLEKSRVQDTLRVVELVAELKACVAGVVGSMGAPQDWEAAAAYVARAARVPDDVLRGGFAAAAVPTVEAPDPPWVTLDSARESLCGLFLREFEKAAAEADGPRVTRFFKLFPLIGRGDVGLDVYGRYVCQGVATLARAVMKEGGGGAGQAGGTGSGNGSGSTARRKDGFYAQALTKLFEHIAHIVDGHGALVERHYGAGQMVKVIERLQMEADVQGGIVVDWWADDRAVDRRLTDVKSYPFSFLVQSFLPQQPRGAGGFTGSPRVNSPALGGTGGGGGGNGSGGGGGSGDVRNSEDEGVNMKEVDGLLSEIAVMLGRWSLYSRFLAVKCKDPDSPDDAPLVLPDVLIKSNLSRKVAAKLITPYNVMTTFYVRRSIEKAFQLDEMPAGLSLNMNRTIESNPPYIISAVDDVMYIVNAVIQKSVATSQRVVMDSAVSTISTLLGADFVGMIQRKMRDESYPRPVIQGGLPPEDKIVSFIVLINSLDMANEYLARIIANRVAPGEQDDGANSSNGAARGGAQHQPTLHDSFPFKNDAKEVAARLRNLNTSFSSKSTELLNEGLQVLFNQVLKPRLRPVLTDAFRDADYTLTEEELLEAAEARREGYGGYGENGENGPDDDDDDLDDDDSLDDVVPRRFERGWDALVKPIARLLTPRALATVLDLTARHLARVLEKRCWAYTTGRRASPHGAMRMERDFGGIAAVVGRGNYAVREVFARTAQMLMVANLEEDEWEEMVRSGDDGEEEDGMVWVLTEEERKRARGLVRA